MAPDLFMRDVIRTCPDQVETQPAQTLQGTGVVDPALQRRYFTFEGRQSAPICYQIAPGRSGELLVRSRRLIRPRYRTDRRWVRS